MIASTNTALDALLLPLANGAVHWPTRPALFLRARYAAGMYALAPDRLVCEQTFKPAADALAAAGLKVETRAQASYPLVLLLPPRQREEARALLARACDLCVANGVIVAAAPNAMGAKSAESDFRALFGIDGQLCKYHCRTFWARIDTARIDQQLLQAWRGLDAPRPIGDGRYRSRPGLFSWNRIDPGSALLAEHLACDFRGHGADLGAGWGYLADQLLARNPQVSALDLYEAEARALELARENLASRYAPIQLDYRWHDVATGLARHYDFIISNPPFHDLEGGTQPALGQRFIDAAARALRPGGRFWLVANRQLPYEAALVAGFASHRIVAERDGFKVIEALKKAQ